MLHIFLHNINIDCMKFTLDMFKGTSCELEISVANRIVGGRAEILQYLALCGTVITDYGGKIRTIGQYSPLQRDQKLPLISAMTSTQ